MVNEQMVNNFDMTKQYIQPEVQVTNINLSSVILAGSAGAGGSSSAPIIHSGIPTDDQW